MQDSRDAGGPAFVLSQPADDHHHQFSTTLHPPATTARASKSPSSSPSPLADGIRALREAPPPSASKLNSAASQLDHGPRRKTRPSPLQQTSHPPSKLYGRDPLSPTSSEIKVRSPRERLDAFLASETPSDSKSFAKSLLASSSTSTHAQLRSVSSPILPPPVSSPPISPTSMLPNRAEPRPVMARNPSLESAASAASSSAAQSSRSNSVNTGKPLVESHAGAPDIAGLIAAAGSAEAALLSLWKDRQSTLSHNSQLWRVVEKQRAMILGLNKDLERALKDKERYRKKVKELTAHDSSKIKATSRADSALDREDSESPAPPEHAESRQPTVDEFPQVPVSSIRGTFAVKTPVPPAIGNAREQNSSISESNNSPVQDSASTVDSVGDHTSIDASPVASSPQGQPESPALDLPILKSSGKEKRAEVVVIHTAKAVTPPTPPRPSATPLSKAPVVSIVEATPIPDSHSFPSPPSRTFRKPAPAPLNLSLSTPSSAPSIEQAVAISIEAIEFDPPELFDRGRRKTREDDDKAREELAVREEEVRSVSKKSKSKSKSKTPAPIEPPLIAETVFPAPADYTSSSSLHQQNPSNLLSPSDSDTSSQQRSSGSAPLLSPGLPVSPRPVDRPMNAPTPRMPKSNIASPPISPHPGSHAFANPPRPSQQSAFSLSSPPAYQTPLFAKPPPNQPLPVPPFQASAPMQPSLSPTTDKSRPENPRREIEQPAPVVDTPSPPPISESVFRGFTSDQFPGLLLPPNAIPLIDVRVFSSRLRPSRHSILVAKPNEEDPVILLGIYARADGRQLWRLEKTIMALQVLHEKVKSFCNFDGKLPDRSLYSGHAPVKIDARRAALNAYLDILLDTPLTEKAALAVCEFFSRDVIGAEPEDSPRNSQTPVDAPPAEGLRVKSRREGYLTKRGKNFGGWKARYFVLESADLRYYDSPSGPQIGIIKLVNAQIGKQSQQQSNHSPASREDDADNQYRHAFLILEPKKKDSTSLVRHVLCAESDEERDAWVEALLQYVEPEEKPSSEPTVKRPATGQSTTSSRETAHSNAQSVQPKSHAPVQESLDSLQALSYDDTIPAEAPIVGPSYKEYIKERGMPSPSLNQAGFGHAAHKASADKVAISGPTNGAVIQDAGMWGNKTPAKEKKRSIFGFRGRSGSDLNGQPNTPALDQRNKPLSRPVFGAPLSEAVELTQPIGLDAPLPAVVYRCIEYLHVRGAIAEEGIFRLSGSNIVIKALRDRFNTEGDVRLLEGEYYDVHAVASLLKLYLRELPGSILTKQQHLDFIKVLDLDEKQKKTQAFNVLVHRLPPANHALLQTLCSFLLEIVENADQNKMNVRNVGIVFAPTLNIPAPLISLFLTDYYAVFGDPLDENQSPLSDPEEQQQQQQADSVRPPRHQMFSDLPTPSYNPSHQAPMPSFQPLSISGGLHTHGPGGYHGHQQPSLPNGRNALAPGTYEPIYRSATPPSAIFINSQANHSASSVGTSPSIGRTNAADQQPQTAVLNPSFRAPSPSPGPSLGGGGGRGSQTPSPSPAQNKRNRRESSMLGAGVMQGRKPSRQTLASTNSSHIPESAWVSYQQEQRRMQTEAQAQQASAIEGMNAEEEVAKGLW